LPAELDQRRRGETRLVALVAEQDQLPLCVAHSLVAPPRGGVTSPLEHVSGNEDSPRDAAVALALGVRADVEEHRSSADRLDGLARIEPSQPAARPGEQLLDRHRDIFAAGDGPVGLGWRTSLLWKESELER
jgi:hypothetical protein